MVEGARLESVYTATYQGFESLALRHLWLQAIELKQIQFTVQFVAPVVTHPFINGVRVELNSNPTIYNKLKP